MYNKFCNNIKFTLWPTTNHEISIIPIRYILSRFSVLCPVAVVIYFR